MSRTQQEVEFDFSKTITAPLKKLERQSYSKVLFLAVGFSVFTSFGFYVKDSIHDHFIRSNAIEAKKVALTLQEIKVMPESEFQNMINFISQNSNIYNDKVHFIQTLIVKAELENYQESQSTSNASNLGEKLDAYKQNLIKDASSLTMIRKNVMNDIAISSDDAELFFKYQTLYKTRSVIHDKNLEDSMHELLYTSKPGNNKYNSKVNAFETIKLLDAKISNTFNVIEAPKPKM